LGPATSWAESVSTASIAARPVTSISASTAISVPVISSTMGNRNWPSFFNYQWDNLHGGIEKAIGKAEREFGEILCGMSSWDHEIEPDVHSLLTDFSDCLDEKCSIAIAVCALDYLSRHR
jgi:hypothetical protein